MRDMDLWHRGQRAIAQGALTNSKNPRSFVFGVYPKYVKYGRGGCLFDCENNRYVDYICGLGASILGYGYDPVLKEMTAHLRQGFSHSLPTHHEVETAEALKSVFPFVESFKLLKTGTEACMAALKIARAATGRVKAFSEGYHGWSDPFVSLTEPAAGVCRTQEMHKLTDIEEIDTETAAVIVEPIISDNSPERIDWLNRLRLRCTEVGAVLIFDEVITGFRYMEFSAARHHNVTPDLICIGKAIANGMPLAAVGGSYALMNGTYFVSSTYAGEVLSLVAAKATIKALQTDNFMKMSTVWPNGQRFMERFNSFYPEKIRLEGYPTRGVFAGDDETIALFFQEAVKAQMLFTKSWFYSGALTEFDDISLNACKMILARIRLGQVRLEGEAPVSPFAQKMREK